MQTTRVQREFSVLAEGRHIFAPRVTNDRQKKKQVAKVKCKHNGITNRNVESFDIIAKYFSILCKCTPYIKIMSNKYTTEENFTKLKVVEIRVKVMGFFFVPRIVLVFTAH